MPDFGTSNIEGVNVVAVYAINTTTAPEYPAAPFAVGTKVMGSNGTEYVFCSNTTGSALAVGDVVTLSTAWAASELSTSNDARGNLVGVVPIAVPASTSTTTQYFWAQRAGFCAAVSVLASCAANVRLNTTATAGALDDDGTAGSMQVQGIYLSAARGASAGTAAGILNYPFVDVTL